MTISAENDELPSSQHDLWTVQRVLTWSAVYLKEKSKDASNNPRLDAELLLAQVLNQDRMKLYLQLDRPLSRDERDSFKALLRRRAEGEPVAYILGYRDFYRHRFKVNSHVLIPRPDTELLVELSLDAMRGMLNPRVLDVGTGSGCIAISIATERRDSVVEAWDKSAEAIQLATENAHKLEVTNISFRQQDAFTATSENMGVFDVVVSNPPYIAKDEVAIMSYGTLHFEPRLALFTRDDDGLEFYQYFAENYRQILAPGGKILVEIGLNQGIRVLSIFQKFGWQNVEVKKDLTGHDRVVLATL